MTARLFDVAARAVNRKALSALVALVACAFLSIVPGALAAGTRTYLSSFGSVSGSNPQALAVDQTSGDVYAIDVTSGVVSRFTAGGLPDNFTAGPDSGTNTLTGFAFDSPSAAEVAVDNSGGVTDGDIYVASFAGVDVYASSGVHLGQLTQAGGVGFNEACGVAVNTAGDVYVGDFGGSVDRYSPSANPVTNADYVAQITGVNSPCNVAADSTGAVYASTYAFGPVTKYDASAFGTSDPGTVIDAAGTGVAVDPATDDVYVDEGNQVSVFDATGTLVYSFGSAADFGANSAGVAVQSLGVAYVADRAGGQVDVFSPAKNAPPKAVTRSASSVHHTSAVLNGRVVPGSGAGGAVDPITDCHFEYGTTTAYGSTAPCSEGGSFSAPANVTAGLGGLSPATTYHFRLDVSTASSGTVSGADHTFAPSDFPVAHTEIAAFGPDGTPGTSFDPAPRSRFGPLAFNQAARSLFVLDAINDDLGGLYGFDASAPPAFAPLAGFAPRAIAAAGNASGIAVDGTATPSAGNVYYASGDTGLIYGFTATGAALAGNFPLDPTTSPGAPAGSPADVHALAVDSSGNLWVANAATNFLLEYSSAGAYLSSLDVSTQMSAFGGPYKIAFDSNDDLYAGSFIGGQGGVWRYTAASSYTVSHQVGLESAEAIAVDPVNHHVFLSPRSTSEVREYDAGGSPVSTFAVNLPGNGQQIAGLAVDGTNHDVYAADFAHKTIHVLDSAVQMVPTLTPGAPTAITASSATLHAAVDPEGIPTTDCHFDYGTDASYGHSVPCQPAPGSGSGDVAVSADLTGIDAGTVYHFRIAAATANGSSHGPDQTLTTLGPRIDTPTATQVHTTDARLSAQVNPAGKPTTYHFEFGTTTAYGLSTPQSGSIGSDTSPHTASRIISGLTPGTTYHYRTVATNADGTTHGADAIFTTYTTTATLDACPNDALRTGPGARLPDCRAYEQASPTNKNGSDAEGDTDIVQASDSGDAVTFLVYGGLPGAVGAQDTGPFLARRGASDWSSQGLLPPAGAGPHAEIVGWTPDLTQSFSIAGISGLGYDLFARFSASGAYTTVASDVAHVAIAGASADGTKVYLDETRQLTPDAAAGRDNLYLWDRAAHIISLVGVLPDSACGTPPCASPGGSFAGPYDWWAGTNAATLARGGPLGATDVRSAGPYHSQQTHVISADGDKAFFTAGDTGQIYLREGLTGPSPHTVQISASQAATADPNGPKPAIFHDATPEGSKALFTSCEKLTSDSTAVSTADIDCGIATVSSGPPAPQGSDLYEYDTESRHLTDLTVDPGATPTNPKGADVQGVLGTSDDGTYVYFAANGDLDEAGPATLGNCQGSATSGFVTYKGTCNLYLAHDGHVTFVARLDPSGSEYRADAVDWAPTVVTDPVAMEKTARVSSDGRTLLFRSRRQLTPYDNLPTDGACGRENDATSPSLPCAEFYRFHVGDPQLRCVSCNPTGAAPVGQASLQSIVGSPLKTVNDGTVITRNLSSDGDRVFFETSDKLATADTNGDGGCPLLSNSVRTPSCQDVYEWEADGSGSCHSADQDGGCLYLLSSGTDPDPAYFADASASGDDAFIFTRSALVPQDDDSIQDVYDVSVGGGLATQHAGAAPPCAGDACQGSATPPRAPGAIGSIDVPDGRRAPGPLRAATASLSVSRVRAVRGSEALLKVKVPAAGRISVSGASVRKAGITATKAATYTVVVTLTNKAKKALKKRTLGTKVRVTFQPSSGRAVSKTVAITFKKSQAIKKNIDKARQATTNAGGSK